VRTAGTRTLDAGSASPQTGASDPALAIVRARMPKVESYNQNLWMHHLTEGAAYLPL
jgi:hypothetical protein